MRNFHGTAKDKISKKIFKFHVKGQAMEKIVVFINFLLVSTKFSNWEKWYNCIKF